MWLQHCPCAMGTRHGSQFRKSFRGWNLQRKGAGNTINAFKKFSCKGPTTRVIAAGESEVEMFLLITFKMEAVDMKGKPSRSKQGSGFVEQIL